MSVRVTVELPGERIEFEILNIGPVRGYRRGDDTYDLTPEGPDIKGYCEYRVTYKGTRRFFRHWQSAGWKQCVVAALRVLP
jgi:hypothetical protein